MARNTTTTYAPGPKSFDFVALSILIETATRLKKGQRRETSGEVPVHGPVASSLQRATKSMSASEYVSARVTMARLLGKVKQLRELQDTKA